ncbi:MAG: GatB/YqeY domain-containing protein [Thermonemataceae bacterium]
MTLKEQLGEQMKAAMKRKDQGALTALRELKSLILLEETKGGDKADLSEAEEMALINKALKQRKESYEMYHGAGKTEQAEEQMAVIKVLETFLPEQLSQEVLEEKIKALIAQVGASSMKDMGKVMGLASKTLAGKADNKSISETVKRLLS